MTTAFTLPNRVRPPKRLLVSCLVLLLAGCPPQRHRGEEISPRPAGTLHLAVAGDPAMAAAIEQLQSEWKAQTGVGLEVTQVPEDDLAHGTLPRADALICPSYHLGPLALDGRIRPISQESLDKDRENWSDVFSTLWVEEARWHNDVMAVPFGSPLFTCYCRSDLLEIVGRKAPRTWAEYQELATLLADRKKLGTAAPAQGASWSGAIEPLGPGWAGLILLARAACYAAHPDNYSTLFHIDTMKPLIDAPPFVRALDELLAAAKTASADVLSLDPAAARATFWQGRCAMAISWPSAADKSGPAELGFPVGLLELPGSADVYDLVRNKWEVRQNGQEAHVALMGIAGRLGVISAHTSRANESLRLLLWLSGEEWGAQVSAASPATTLFRQSHLSAPHLWVEKQIPSRVAADYARQTSRILSGQPRLFAPRIPGRAEYLAALDEAVRQALRGQKTSQEALRQAAAVWDQLTDRLGRRSQQAACWESLGLD